MAAHPVDRILVSVVFLLNLSSVVGCSGLSTTPAPSTITAPIATALPTKTQPAPPTITPPTSAVKTLAPTKTLDPIETVKPTREPSPTTTWTPYPTLDLYSPAVISMLDECRGVVDGMHDLKKNLDLMWPPDHLLEDTPYRQVNDFNPNRYFDILTHLKMVEGYKLDYVYSAEELGGMPQLYARRSNREQFQSYAEFLESFGEADSNVGSFSTPDHRYDYLENIRLAKAPQSYFELITLAKLGDHFYLWWHAGYHDEIILCDPNDLEVVDANLQSDDLELPENVRDRIGEIDFKPVVIVGEKVVTVRFITFTKWGGFYENVYVMDKENPLHIIETQYNPLIEYDCGMRF